MLKPPFSACRTYLAKVANSGEPRACSLLGRGRENEGLKLPLELFGGEGVTARMVECAVEGRTGDVGVGGGCGRGRKCVDMLCRSGDAVIRLVLFVMLTCTRPEYVR